MADYGIKVAQPGESADGPDSRLVFSSSWKLLNIIHEESFTSIAAGATAYTHGLGYVPLFLPYTNQRFQGSATGIASFNHTFGARIWADDTKFYNKAGSPTLTGRVIITPINIEEDYEAPTVKLDNTSQDGNIDRDWGIKVALEGKDINSTDSRDFAIHSGYRTPMLHKIKNFTKAGGSETLTVTHDLEYPPFVLVYLNIDYDPGWQLVNSTGDVGITISETEVNVTLGYPCKLSVVVFKDPLEF